MGKSISRFIQISDAVLLEYCINKDYDGIALDDDVETLKVSANTDHILTTLSGELMYVDSSYMNNLAVPMNKENSEYFNTNTRTDISFDDYAYAYKIASGKELDDSIKPVSESLPYDTIKLHISTGYSFNTSYGFFIKVYVKSYDDDQKNAVLLSYTYNKNFSKYTYNTNPIYFSNRMYDKYIELHIPSVNYLSLNPSSSFTKTMNIQNGLNNINILYNSLYDQNYTLYDNDALNSGLFNSTKITSVFGEFNIERRSATSIPLVATTDNFNINISENSSGDYIEYYTTWNGDVLNASIVSKFNTIIPLYNISRTTYQERYEESGLETQDMWYVVHTLNVYILTDDNSYLLDNISNTQFFKDNSATKFYYRPIPSRITELGISVTDINSIAIKYEAKLVNAVDGTGTQILRSGSIAVDPKKYIINSTNTLAASDLFNYTIYNKIQKINQTIEATNDISKVKYTKVFYNSSNISLTGSTGTYTLVLGNSPKNYKFTFTQQDSNGNTDYLNFSNSYYKLYSKDVNGADIYVDATYSENMNTVLGELEFYIPSSVISKLKAVPTANRFMSIVAINQDNTITTVYEFTYE